VPVEDVIAQSLFGDVEMTGDSTPDGLLIGGVGDTEIGEGDVVASAIEANVGDHRTVQLCGHGCGSWYSRYWGRTNATVGRTSLKSILFLSG
jgi:hypothetical protein